MIKSTIYLVSIYIRNQPMHILISNEFNRFNFDNTDYNMEIIQTINKWDKSQLHIDKILIFKYEES